MVLTELETKALEIIEAHFEETASYLLPYICKELNITLNQAKGVMGSLVNKGYVIMGNCNGENTFIFNDEKEG